MPRRSNLSRRTALHLGASSLALGLLGTRRLHGSTQEASPAAVGAADLPPLLAAYEAAWNAHDDGSQLATLFTEDGTFEDVPFGITYRGRAEIAQYAVINFTAVPDSQIPTTSGFVTEGHAANEWIYRGTYTGQYPGMPPGSGQPAAFRGTHIMELAGEQIAHVRAYYDVYGLLVQLGFAPPPGSPATPAG